MARCGVRVRALAAATGAVPAPTWLPPQGFAAVPGAQRSLAVESRCVSRPTLQHARWDAVGLVLGDPASTYAASCWPSTRSAVVDEAVLHDADLLVTHHPLFLKGVHGSRHRPQGRVAHRLVSNGALFTAHTNADSPGGVSSRWRSRWGSSTSGRSRPTRRRRRQDRGVRAGRRRRPGARGARRGRRRARSATTTQASFTDARRGPLPAARRRVTRRSARSVAPRSVDEVRIETVCPRHLRGRAVAAMRRRAPLRGAGVRRGRAGPARRAGPRLGPDRPAAGQPMTLRGVRGPRLGRARRDGARRAGGRRARPVRRDRGAVRRRRRLPARPGAGGRGRRLPDLRPAPPPRLGAARARGAGAGRRRALGGGERPGCRCSGGRLADALGDTVEVRVSTTNTDPWTFRV